MEVQATRVAGTGSAQRGRELRLELDRLQDGLLRAMSWLAGLLILFMVGAVTWSVISRRLLGNPQAWVTEVSAYLLLYATFLTAPRLAREQGHVRVDLVLHVAGPQVRRWLDRMAAAVSAAAAGLLVWYGAIVSYDALRTKAVVANVLQTPKVWLLAVIPAGALLVLVEYLRHAVGLGQAPAGAPAPGAAAREG